MAHVGDVIDNPITGERITFLQTSGDTGGKLLQIDLVVQPGGFPIGAHIHPKQEERFKVVTGRLRAWLNDREQNLVAGDKLIIPAGTPHYWKNMSNEAIHLIVEFRPALQWETLFETMFGLARDGKTDKQGRPNPLHMAVIFNEFEDEAQPVAAMDRILFKLIPLLAQLGMSMGYKAVYPRYSK